jgi:para-aminobenzoate synthetase / 4-amino-4-deoxychorismate lyase
VTGAARLPSGTARLVREALPAGPDPPVHAARWLRGEPRPVALSGSWAGGGLLVTSHPAPATPADDPFATVDLQPSVQDAADGAVGGGWFGWLGFDLARVLEPVPPPPPRPVPMPPFDLAFHDHVVRCDADGRWWFEALWTQARAAVLAERLRTWHARLAGPPPPAQPFGAGPLRVGPSGTVAHAGAVAETVERIAAGEIFQANICLRLEGELSGDALDLWVGGVAASNPAYAAFVGGDGHAVASLSPELFLRARAGTVVSEPIKGTTPATGDPLALAASAKDRAENIMIVDLMRNDLGRVCAYGTITVPELCAPRPAAGVWHLVSTVRGTLREDATTGALLRATFPPGSVTGAPKVQALRVISELEGTAREAYCGAVGLASPVSGLELNVAIRTFETRAGRLWLGAGGGIVSDSSPAAEVDEALAKARGVAATVGVAVEATGADAVPAAARTVHAARPDRGRGVLETLLVTDGACHDVDAHLARLRASCAALGLAVAPDLEQQAAEAAAPVETGRLRIVVDGAGTHVSTGALPPPGPTTLRPAVLPGGLGAHKWADRVLVDSLSAPGVTPLFCDLDGQVLEAGYAAVLIVEGDVVVAPPLDGRVLPSVSRLRALQLAPAAGLTVKIEPFTLQRARRAHAVVLTSALRGPHPGVLTGGPPVTASATICARWLPAMAPRRAAGVGSRRSPG